MEYLLNFIIFTHQSASASKVQPILSVALLGKVAGIWHKRKSHLGTLQAKYPSAQCQITITGWISAVCVKKTQRSCSLKCFLPTFVLFIYQESLPARVWYLKDWGSSVNPWHCVTDRIASLYWKNLSDVVIETWKLNVIADQVVSEWKVKSVPHWQ